MTDPLQVLIDHLRTLEAQWRERSKEWRDDEDELMYTNGPDLLESCADELAAALAGSAGIPSSLNSKKDEVLRDGTGGGNTIGVATASANEPNR